MSAMYDVVPSLYKALSVIQHRGQESAGISAFNGEITETVKGNGLVSVALSDEKLKDVAGHCGIGHVRYSTTGSKAAVNAQPLTVDSTFGTIAIAHNGDITNFAKLKEEYMKKGWSFLTDSDSEMVARILSKHLAQTEDVIDAIRATMKELDGAYSLAIMIKDRIFGVRDPYGFRPLCIGKFKEAYMMVSESAALDTLRGEFVRDVEPGEIVEITSNSLVSYPPMEKCPKAHCMFEWIYFARPDSIMDGREVYDVRKKVGMILARDAPADVDLIMPIPDSGRAHALGYSIGSGIRYEEGFMKNRFVERTFILPDQKARENAVSLKMNPIKSTVNGKRVLIVDDSIVRGTTLKQLIGMLRDAGAKEVHVRIGCPPVIAPCYYGTDIDSAEGLIANHHTTEEIARIIGVDSLGYLSLEHVRLLTGEDTGFCTACFGGGYPTAIPTHGEKSRFEREIYDDSEN